MLTQEEVQIIRETVPLLKDKGQTITSTFYKRLFEQHPELKNVFNQTNQKRGLQSSALAMAVLAAAENIEDLSPIVPAIMPVVYKHCALQVKAEHYPIVGENLIWAIQQETGLNEDDPIIQTWIKAYGAIADAFINLEKDVYSKMAWDGFKPFTVTNITEETDMIKSFTVTSDEIDLSQFIPGQYITVDISSEKLPYRAKRHYSIVDGDKDFLTFGVRRDVTEEHEGEVSTVLHDEVNVGDTLLLSAPVGGFGLANKANKQLFLGSGVGVTPLVSMYQEAVDADLTATFLQSTSNAQNVAFEEKLEDITAKSSIAQFDKHFRDQDGFIDAEQLKQYLDDETEVYVCGGNSFLKAMITELQKLEVPMDNIHFETFIPRLSFSV
ncbi:nitric oxide dioxygenase [Staphylococcus nepalensis]|jgi:nitric oxide dioxygenase|uniref:nitric oxide dioxygenase n=1 Tax=Staphylococcus nepalensis TaxID=214473 RepID=A0ABS3L1U7_9STAP|nr:MULTISPECIES: globin domain-containing protein [Staphylococcus]MBO1214733.1 nitric oxide dioxygenase [Staphylococcus nepalensis]MBO1227490.1 nitric oxide dioxygenase [Staphylococcus nepalensis]MBO1235569.1 nitric oxide dioxygenase [Staphylococcus nepalensis]MBO1238077.1 nitric oxide dioxygenase [Staphylococcus nepalensis]MCD8892331.1 nitric oxide dioxygenase [Staphylococcus nepalensis]